MLHRSSDLTSTTDEESMCTEYANSFISTKPVNPTTTNGQRYLIRKHYKNRNEWSKVIHFQVATPSSLYNLFFIFHMAHFPLYFQADYIE